MSEQNRNKAPHRYVLKIIGVVLILGGLLGIAASVPAVIHFAHEHQVARVISAIMGIALFAWSIPTGVGIWRESACALKWAKILFALQIPVFSIGRVVYEYSNFLSLRIMVGNTSHNFGGDIGSSSDFYLLPQSPGFMFGVNLFALIVLVYLIARPRRHRKGLVF
jgi:hypothetical protein